MNNEEQEQSTIGWGSACEIDFIDFVVSDEPRGFGKKIPTTLQKIQKLNCIIKSYRTRIWGGPITLFKCYDYATAELNKLIAKG